MICHMKTTIDTPNALMIRAKKRAAELRRPLRELIMEGLEIRLRNMASTSVTTQPRKIRWVVVQGGVPPGLDITD